MLINRNLILASEARGKAANLHPAALDKALGDGPLKLSAEDKQHRMRQLLAISDDVATARIGLERIIAGNDLDSINYLARGVAASRPVCRIQLKDASNSLIGYASGFMIGPGVLLTNNHVFGKDTDAANSLADFNYELDINDIDKPPVHFAFLPKTLFYTNPELDYSVVAVAPKSIDSQSDLVSWGWHLLNGEPGKADEGEYLTIIQHPGGEKKQVCVRENKLLKFVNDMVWYLTDTTAGSSGSPVFNRFWQVVALHHSGIPNKNKKGQTLTKDGKVWDPSMDESTIDWVANEGVRISAIVADLKLKMGNHPLVKAALGTKPPLHEVDPISPMLPKTFNAGQSGVWVEQNGDTASLVVPMRFPIDWVRTAAAAPAPVARRPIQVPTLVEAVHIDQTTLGTRPGYLPDFLGKGTLSVPLPKLPASLKSKVAALTAKPAQSELKYSNYSVVMNRQRKLAFFAAVNIDGAQQQDVGKREGDSWLRDPRIDKAAQIGDEFYGKQATLEADRSQNPFDRGHLVRRLDATWGKTVDLAKQHGDDSFHFTNCSPQFWSFNQGKQLWAGLEDYTRDLVLQNKFKATVINGPIFDGPDAAEGELPAATDPSAKDPTFGGIAIPKFFWKILVTVKNKKLAAAAFVMSQRDQIFAIDRIKEADIFEKLSEAQASVFQVSIADLTKFTKLDFGALAKVDTHEATAPGPRRIESYDDIQL